MILIFLTLYVHILNFTEYDFIPIIIMSNLKL